MANYTVADIQALRERTGAGMLDVKKALDEADGDQDKAVEVLRVKGLKGVAAPGEGGVVMLKHARNGVGIQILGAEGFDDGGAGEGFIAGGGFLWC